MKRILLLLLLGSPVFAATRYAEFGIMADTRSSVPYSDQKLVEIGEQWHGKLFEYTVGLGGWGDGDNVNGVKSSAYVQTLWGVEPRSEHFYLHYLVGPSLITHTDVMLGSHFEFAQEIGFGMLDVRGVRVGVAVKHYSDAGLTKTNEGRNFAVFTAGF